MTGASYNKNLEEVIKKVLTSGESKIIIVDSGGNVISDISLSALRDALRGTDGRTLTDLYKKAYDSTNDREKISIENDAAGLAKDSTLASRLPREIELDDGTGTYDKIFRSGNALLVSVNEDKVGLLKEGGNVNVVNNPPNLDIPLSDHKDYIINALQPIRGTPVEDLSSYSIAAGEIKDITKSNLDGYSALMVTVKATYDPSATAGLRVRWLYSPDGTTFDSPEDAEDKGRYEDLTFDAGATRVRTILIPIFAPHVKIQLVNLDSTYAVTVSMWSWVYR